LATQWHRVDNEQPLVRKVQHNQLEHVPRTIRSDDEQPRWIAIGFEVDNDEWMPCGMQNVLISNPVSASRSVDLLD
jgi:hypothetical protein